MELVKKTLIGIIIGTGLILPGVSGAVLAVIFGIYDKMINALSNFFKDWRNNLLFLMPLFIGVTIGIFVFGNVLSFLFREYPVEARFVFMGLIIGGLPVLFNQTKRKGHKKINFASFYIALFMALTLFVFGTNVININFSANLNNDLFSYIILFFTGIIYIAGKIIPGISGSLLLMLIGMYEYVLDVIANFFRMNIYEYLKLMPFFFGIVVGAIILVKLVDYLLKDHYNATYSAITGFVIGSLPALYPGISFNISGLVCLFLILLSFSISYIFSTNRDKII
jgi:putative membrane protein